MGRIWCQIYFSCVIMFLHQFVWKGMEIIGRMKDWMKNEESWMRGQQTCPLTIHFNMWTVSSDISIQRRHWQPLSVHLWAYCTHPAHEVNDVMCEGWPQHQGLCPLLFSNCAVMDLYLQPKHSSWSKLIMGLSATTFLLKDNSTNTINTNLSSKSLRILNQ